jgi:hypothetical protein
MYGHGFRHDFFNLVRHDAKLAANAPLCTIFTFIIEEIKAKASRVGACVNDILLGIAVATLPRSRIRPEPGPFLLRKSATWSPGWMTFAMAIRKLSSRMRSAT